MLLRVLVPSGLSHFCTCQHTDLPSDSLSSKATSTYPTSLRGTTRACDARVENRCRDGRRHDERTYSSQTARRVWLGRNESVALSQLQEDSRIKGSLHSPICSSDQNSRVTQNSSSPRHDDGDFHYNQNSRSCRVFSVVIHHQISCYVGVICKVTHLRIDNYTYSERASSFQLGLPRSLEESYSAQISESGTSGKVRNRDFSQEQLLGLYVLQWCRDEMCVQNRENDEKADSYTLGDKLLKDRVYMALRSMK